MASIYNLNQQVFCLNTISNLGNMYHGTADAIAAQTKTSINSILGNAQIIGLIGNWCCVWGPKVVAAEGKALNTMYIAKNADTAQYVIAIAGTDSKSLLDWFLEDFLVTTKVDWPYISDAGSPHPMTSLSTSIGLNALIGMAEVIDGDHIHARDYLEKVAAKNVMVTGHSLGGALSPAYALYLYDTMSQWALRTQVTISCLPVAGATPGDKAFSDHYQAQLGASTTRVWNVKDVVPHGFEQDMLRQIAAIYEPQIKTPIAIKGAVELIRLLTVTKGYTQLMPDVSGISSKICDSITTFDQELLCQHICAYADYFQISTFQTCVQSILGLPSPFFSDGCS